ncbi:MAG: hypothetical protein A2087_03710 [Spirochaetes bacterium GWD1_61_31]|nr:MAG: hypothetical protein A2Y37_09435 [Spirochaetes bacterium GWB1_60_80]OHD32829.1 MAG: hypothetical protein A2004_11130 [Spirochaetes bacterium GWC1_61_12]OHD35072.1 MAG: hypothetical protein A2087_03710 [Spirochaetes bacterium GWD1_61_31]OHD42762.1 MAG: hypothetical protein A2Y35_05760 [Spirochaetes bacterium GWE1_60_18]OHD58614.1 MAG: hypothetical protein A2Y32_04685 [Spirochaetes bacterium GWF1_60_12]HAP44450.1 hypothetical protein [Spirochaetaceae bacterium]
MTRRITLALAGVALAWVSFACSSIPRGQTAVNDRKNEAAGYVRLADDFFAKNQYAAAANYYSEALVTNLAVDYIEGAIAARSSLGRVYLALGAIEDATREMNDAWFDAQMLNNPDLVALCLNNLGELYYRQDDQTAAEANFNAAAGMIVEDARLLAIINHNRGVAALARQALDEAQAFFELARQANQKANRWSEFAANCYMLAAIENIRENLTTAIDWAEQALAADKRAENAVGIEADLVALAKLNRKVGNALAAFDYFRRAFQVGLQLNDVAIVRLCLEQLVELAASLEKPDYVTRYQALLDRLDE